MTTAAARHPSDTAVRSGDQFAAARAVADAVLYEGYLLYPYRRSSGKNQVRWQFGVLAPAAWIESQGVPDPGVSGAAESWFQHIECLAEVPPRAALRLRLRFLQLQHKQCWRVSADGNREPVDELTGGTTHLTFDEALPREIDAEYAVADLLSGAVEVPVSIAGDHSEEPVADGVVTRTSWPIEALVRVSAAPAATPFPALRFTARVENRVTDADPHQPRPDVLQRSLVATHLLLGLNEGTFLSLLDAPAWAAEATAACSNRHAIPVLAGADDGSDVVLCSPIILYDHPQVAPESPGDLHDAVEIDEILSLRTLTLTDDEKAEARATDPRAAQIVDRVDTMPPEMMAKLHGAIRDLRPVADELPDHVVVAGRSVRAGSRVRLRPRTRGTDAHDMFLTGRTARVHEVLHDVDGSIYLAVIAEDDPAGELNEWYGRFFHFSPDEVEPLS